jgi:hypothetical protein
MTKRPSAASPACILKEPGDGLDRLDEFGMQAEWFYCLPVRHVVVPVSQVGQTLTVAMNDPSDLEAAEDLAQSTGCVIRVVTSSLRSIQDAIHRLYSPGATVPETDPLESLELVHDVEEHARKVDHWRTLVLARAIENTAYVVAAAQPTPRYTGHSMVVDPRGDVLAEAGDGDEVITAVLERDVLEEARRTNPSLANRRM